MQEQWIKWEPIQGLANEYYIESVSDTFNGFRVTLFDAKEINKKVHVIFDDSVDSYIRTDESFRSNMMFNLSQQYGKEFWHNWVFLKS